MKISITSKLPRQPVIICGAASRFEGRLHLEAAIEIRMPLWIFHDIGPARLGRRNSIDDTHWADVLRDSVIKPETNADRIVDITNRPTFDKMQAERATFIRLPSPPQIPELTPVEEREAVYQMLL